MGDGNRFITEIKALEGPKKTSTTQFAMVAQFNTTLDHTTGTHVIDFSSANILHAPDVLDGDRDALPLNLQLFSGAILFPEDNAVYDLKLYMKLHCDAADYGKSVLFRVLPGTTTMSKILPITFDQSGYAETSAEWPVLIPTNAQKFVAVLTDHSELTVDAVIDEIRFSVFRR